jgi:DNA-binding HxlR family transcriptional regulator
MAQQNDFRMTQLDSRLQAMRNFLALMLAHMQDNGLIDREVFEANLWSEVESWGSSHKADEDMQEVLDDATRWAAGWARQRS